MPGQRASSLCTRASRPNPGAPKPTILNPSTHPVVFNPPHPAPKQNSVLKTWKGEEANYAAAQQALLKRAKANSEAQLGKYDPAGESADAAKGMFEKGYVY